MASEDPSSGDLLDVALRDEIELVSDLVVAASSTQRHFTRAEVDALLGVVPTFTTAATHTASATAPTPATA